MNFAAASIAVTVLLLIWSLVRLVRSDNPLEWWHFISTRGEDGHNYADLDKLGKVAGIIFGSWAVMVDSYSGKADATVLGVYFAFVGGIAGYSAYLRARQRGGDDHPR